MIGSWGHSSSNESIFVITHKTRNDSISSMKPKAQKITVIIVFLLVIIFGIGQFFGRIPISGNSATDQNTAVAPTPTPTPTQIVAFVPQPASSTPVVKGSCWTSSIAAPYRTDAWRCTVGNSIQDPCFAINGSTSTLLCGMDPANPAATSSFVLSLTKPIPVTSSSIPEIPSNWAWLVELQDGTVCSPFTGTLPFAADQEVAEYGCAPKVSGGPAWDIFGDLNASSGVWTAKIGMLSASTSTFPPPIVTSSVVSVMSIWQ